MKTNQTPPPPRARGATLREIVVEVTNMIPERGHFVLPRIMLAPSPRLSSPRLPHHVFVSTRRAHPSPAGERTTLPGLPPPASAAPPLLGSLSRWRAASPPRLLCQRPPPSGSLSCRRAGYPSRLLCQLCAATHGFPLRRRACYPSRAPPPASRHPNPGASPFFNRVSSTFIEGKSLFFTI
jgi:hypothetical protein